MLSKHPGACRFPHGHSRVVEVVLVARELDTREMVCDFKAVKNAVEDVVERWDHALCVNTLDPHFASLRAAFGERVVGFEGEDPTSEVMARRIFRDLKRRLAAGAAGIGSGVQLEKVRVTETRASWAEYYE